MTAIENIISKKIEKAEVAFINKDWAGAKAYSNQAVFLAHRHGDELVIDWVNDWAGPFIHDYYEEVA